MLLAKKLQHLLVKLNQKFLRASVFVRLSEMRAERVVAVENDYQRTELPAKGDGQWILFRWKLNQTVLSIAPAHNVLFASLSFLIRLNKFKVFKFEFYFPGNTVLSIAPVHNVLLASLVTPPSLALVASGEITISIPI